MFQYRANKCVFKSLRSCLCSLVTLGSLKLSGNRGSLVLLGVDVCIFVFILGILYV